MRVVLLHGLGRSPADWEGVRARLGATAEVVAPSLPARPAAARAAALHAMGPRDVVIGHSFGGVLALGLPASAIVVTGCFFPWARNGRGVPATVADYVAHRIAFARGRRRGGGTGSLPALLSLARLALRPATFGADVAVPVLAVHARDDHHVPVDFAVAAARSRGWGLRVLERGGHHAHRDAPDAWADVVLPWLAAPTPAPCEPPPRSPRRSPRSGWR